MKLPSLRSLFRREEQRTIGSLPWDIGGTVSQRPITDDAALSLVPVFAAVRILATQVASLPMQTFRKVGDQRTKLPLPSLFTSPSVIGTQYDWLHRCVSSLALRGNAYGLVTQRNALGYPTMVEWLHPDHVQVQDRALYGPGSFTQPIWYWLGRVVNKEDIVHIPWFTVPYRVKGLSPMEACAAAVSTGISAQDYTANWFANGAVPPGVFKNIQKQVAQAEATEIKNRLKAAIRTREPLVHGVDWEYSPIAVAAHEAKFIETQKLTATQIANIYGVPAAEIGGDSGQSGMTYRNENNSGLDFVKYTLRPWLELLEEKFSGLLPQPQFVKFNLDAILRADLPTRMASYVEARNIGIMSVDEIRALEDLPPLPDGKGQDYTPLLVQVSQSRGIDAAQVKSGEKPSTPAVPEPTRLRAVVGYEDAEVVDGPKALPGASAAVELEARRYDPSHPHAMERNFDPAEPRDPHSGKWSSIGGAVRDALKLAGRIQLNDDEKLVGSQRISPSGGHDVDTLIAVVDSSRGREVRLGIIPTHDAEKWKAANAGGTAKFSPREAAHLRDDLSEANAKAKKAAAQADREWASGGHPDLAEPVASGKVPSGWGDLSWNVYLTDDDPTSWTTSLEVDGSDAGDSVFSPKDLQKLLKALDTTVRQEGRAAGVDTHPGDAHQLHDYWTKGEGLAKWADSPKPWTTLFHLLWPRYIKSEDEAKRTATNWFHDVFHFYPGSDLNRVTHGKPPRGHKVGPG